MTTHTAIAHRVLRGARDSYTLGMPEFVLLACRLPSLCLAQVPGDRVRIALERAREDPECVADMPFWPSLAAWLSEQEAGYST